MARDLLASRELAWRLFVRNISAQYRQTALGYLWAFLPPLVTTGLWVALNRSRVLSVGETPIPYAAFVLVGTLLWQVFADALNSPLRLVTQSKAMLAKINFPREALILAAFGEVFFNFLVRLVLLVGVLVWYELPLSWTITLAPLGVFTLIALGMMLGLAVTPLGILYQDVQMAVAILLQVWFFLTPIIYPPPESGFLSLVTKLNPVTPILLSTRDWLTIGPSAHTSGLLLVGCCTSLFGLAAWILYRIAMPHLIARMAA
jgi:lipopolysaccharide transport system permease protein